MAIGRTFRRQELSPDPLHRETQEVGLIYESDHVDHRVQHRNVSNKKSGDNCRDHHLVNHKAPRFQ